MKQKALNANSFPLASGGSGRGNWGRSGDGSGGGSGSGGSNESSGNAQPSWRYIQQKLYSLRVDHTNFWLYREELFTGTKMQG